MSTPKVAIVGAGSAGLTLAWLCSVSGMETHVYELRPNYISSKPGQSFYFFPAYHRQIHALYDYLGLYTEPRHLAYAYEDASGKFKSDGELLRGLRFERTFPLAKLRIKADFKKIIRQTQMPPANRPKSIQLKQLMRGLNIATPAQGHPIPAILGALWQYPQDEIDRLPADDCLEFLNLLLADPTARCLYEGPAAYTRRLLFKGDWKFFPGHPVKQIIRNPEGTYVREENGKKHAYDKVILTCDLDEMQRLIHPLSDEESSIFCKMRYTHMRSYVHSDRSILPKSVDRHPNRDNQYALHISQYPVRQESRFSYHYNMNFLQNMPANHWLSLNPAKEPAKDLVRRQGIRRCLGTDIATLQSLKLLDRVQGKGNIWHAGDYTNYQTSSFNASILAALRLTEKLGLTLPFKASETKATPV